MIGKKFDRCSGQTVMYTRTGSPQSFRISSVRRECVVYTYDRPDSSVPRQTATDRRKMSTLVLADAQDMKQTILTVSIRNFFESLSSSGSHESKSPKSNHRLCNV